MIKDITTKMSRNGRSEKTRIEKTKSRVKSIITINASRHQMEMEGKTVEYLTAGITDFVKDVLDRNVGIEPRKTHCHLIYGPPGSGKVMVTSYDVTT